jgi:threonylcarbamoyladenosine tRNA methylthiotransferase MtaB
MRVGLYTFGCKLNQYETEALAAAFRAAGHDVGGVRDERDLYIVNTCTVTSKGEQKARRLVRELARERGDSVVVVTGCYAETDAPAVERLGANVVCVPQSEKPVLLRVGSLLPAGAHGLDLREGVLDALRGATQAGNTGAFSYSVPRTTFHARASVKIQDGCDYGCTYCRVPLARGKGVSRDATSVVAEAAALEAAGYREIVVTGVNIAAWTDGERGLEWLLGKLLSQTRLPRFRLSSLEPEKVRGPLLEILGHERVCPHFHLPVQSLADPVLRRMGRRYTAAGVRDAVRALRDRADDPFVAADVIAGFPGESREDHEATVAGLRELGIARLHVFPFSPRPGTAAAEMRPRTPERVRDERTAELRKISIGLHRSYTGRWLGRSVDVLVEEPGRGTSGNYLKVALPADSAGRGELVRVVLRDVQGVLSGIAEG